MPPTLQPTHSERAASPQAGQLQYCDVQQGSGEAPLEGDLVVVDYTARAVASGTTPVYDGSSGFKFFLGQGEVGLKFFLGQGRGGFKFFLGQGRGGFKLFLGQGEVGLSSFWGRGEVGDASQRLDLLGAQAASWRPPTHSPTIIVDLRAAALSPQAGQTAPPPLTPVPPPLPLLGVPGQVIPGWELAILGTDDLPAMRPGGIRTVVIPPDLAYGERGDGCLFGLDDSCRVPPASAVQITFRYRGLGY